MSYTQHFGGEARMHHASTVMPKNCLGSRGCIQLTSKLYKRALCCMSNLFGVRYFGLAAPSRPPCFLVRSHCHAAHRDAERLFTQVHATSVARVRLRIVVCTLHICDTSYNYCYIIMALHTKARGEASNPVLPTLMIPMAGLLPNQLGDARSESEAPFLRMFSQGLAQAIESHEVPRLQEARLASVKGPAGCLAL